jgi:hypothetical protein
MKKPGKRKRDDLGDIGQQPFKRQELKPAILKSLEYLNPQNPDGRQMTGNHSSALQYLTYNPGIDYIYEQAARLVCFSKTIRDSNTYCSFRDLYRHRIRISTITLLPKFFLYLAQIASQRHLYFMVM